LEVWTMGDEEKRDADLREIRNALCEIISVIREDKTLSPSLEAYRRKWERENAEARG
jgi:hypothetical protein